MGYSGDLTKIMDTMGVIMKKSLKIFSIILLLGLSTQAPAQISTLQACLGGVVLLGGGFFLGNNFADGLSDTPSILRNPYALSQLRYNQPQPHAFITSHALTCAIPMTVLYGEHMLENLRSKDKHGKLVPKYACQDRLFMVSAGSKIVFGVCDGHGDEGGVIANQVAHTLSEQIANSKNICIADSFRYFCKEMQDRLLTTSEAKHSGTTFVAAALQGTTLTVANVGDSRLIVINPSRNSLVFTTCDHKATRSEYRRNRLALSRAFGDVDMYERKYITSQPDVTEVPVKQGYYVVVASDGYWDVVSNKETVKIIFAASRSKSLGTEDLAKKLTELARSRGSVDDISVLVVCLHVNDTSALPEHFSTK